MNGIDRREALATMVAGAGLASLATGCSGTSRPQTAHDIDELSNRLDPEAADQLIQALDRRLQWIDQQTLPEDILPARPAKDYAHAVELEQKTSLSRKSLRSLYLTGRFIDLPDELKAHPGVQARVASLEPDMNDSVLGMTELLARMTPEDHRRVQRHLRNDPKLGERIARYLEKPALEDGIPLSRRYGLRTGVLQLSDRMRAQSPALITDPLVRKVQRIQARPRTDAEQTRLMAARLGQDAFWAHQEKMAALNAAWLERIGSRPLVMPGAGAAVASRAVSGSVKPSAKSPGRNTTRTGLTIMGFGLGSVAAGLLLWGLAEATAVEGFFWAGVVLGVTVGPILLVTGLVVLIVGAIMRASED